MHESHQSATSLALRGDADAVTGCVPEDRALHTCSTVTLFFIAAVLCIGTAAGRKVVADPLLSVGVRDDGFYRINFEDLDPFTPPLHTGSLLLTSAGRPVPMVVNDGDDGEFGPGDSLRFTGRRLAGESTWRHLLPK